MCESCGGKGFTEGYHGVSASWTPSLYQCPKRCNIKGYSDEVQKRLNNPAHVTQAQVLPNVPPSELTERQYNRQPRPLAQVIQLHARKES